MNIARCLALGVAILASLANAAPDEDRLGKAAHYPPNRQPVKAVGDRRLEVRTAAGTGVLALYASRALQGDDAQADIERAVLVVHGRLRNADVYWRSAQRAQQAAPVQGPHTLLVVPQFLAERDLAAHRLAADTLRWSLGGWEGGEAALGPAPISSFEAIDAILAVLADRRHFPRLTEVVVAGHSGGGQVVQRYAVVGEPEARLAAAGIKLRYVVANPSSYLYFD
ncbi:MAG TPA: alpha/beta hydrolase, partial [Burkholderiaceae bacterium]|nr:alpha/beta hydrolase [Burkholderiaceae bacterium]